MEVLEFTNSNAFNAVFTIYVHITILLTPMFAAFALLRN